jgi:hypothetical protein
MAPPAPKATVPGLPPARARFATEPGLDAQATRAADAITPNVPAAAPAAAERTPPPVPATALDARVDARMDADAAVDQAVATLKRTVLELQGRLEELHRRVRDLEQRPAPDPMVAHAAGHAVVTSYAPYPPSPSAAYIPVATSIAPAYPPAFDLAAIERDVHVEMTGWMDGRRRRLRNVLSITLFLGLLFAILFTALALSYSSP